VGNEMIFFPIGIFTVRQSNQFLCSPGGSVSLLLAVVFLQIVIEDVY